MEAPKNVAELRYGARQGEQAVIELTLPHGMRAADFARYSDFIFKEAIAKLPRGCEACFSGEGFFIREQLEHVVLVDLQEQRILEA